ncbi:MAG: nucleotidyltransferase domain-containing protein [Pseudomonadota bacterium]
MVEAAVVNSVRRYLGKLVEAGLEARFAVVFGSQISGESDAWSDIDVVVVSPVFDGAFPREAVNRLWRIAARTDSRIEPVPCGELQWLEDTGIPIIETARKEGLRVSPEKD